MLDTKYSFSEVAKIEQQNHESSKNIKNNKPAGVRV